MVKNIELVSNKEYISEKLKQNRNFFSSEFYEYLVSLIELEISVLSNFLSLRDSFFYNNQLLCKEEFYREIVIYNIYHRAIDLFSHDAQKEFIEILGNNDNYQGLIINGLIEYYSFHIFKFNYGINNEDTSLSNDDYIGNISLFQISQDDSFRLKYLEFIRCELEKLKNEKSIYVDSSIYATTISTYEKKLSQYENKRELTSVEKMMIDIQKHFNDLILKDYGIHDYHDMYHDNHSICDRRRKISNSKVLVKKYPGVTVEKHIQYIL